MAPKDRPRHKSSKSTDEEYILTIHGVRTYLVNSAFAVADLMMEIPRHCRWQELKDEVRAYAPHNRQAWVHDDTNGNPSGIGSIVITSKEEALRVYQALSRNGWNGQSIKVALAVRSRGGDPRPFKGPTQSPVPQPQPRPTWRDSWASSPRYPEITSPPISPSHSRYATYPNASDNVYPASAPYTLLANTQIVEVPVMVPVYTNPPPGPSYPQYPNGQFPAAPGVGSSSQSLYNAAPPAYSNHSRGTPVQTSYLPTAGLPSHGSRGPTSAPATTVSTSRRVFLSGIPPNGAWQNLKDLLQRFGHVERCDVPRDKHHPDRAKGTATAEFSSTDEALKAIKQLNGFKWEGSVIRARFDQANTSRALGRATASRFQSVERNEGPAGSGVTSARLQAQRRRPSDGPLVVNGSRGTVIPSKSRRGSKEDDGDASEVDSSDDEDGMNVHRGETE